MSKLIQLRQRIKVIETIEKITHAMQLISMSIHTHLKREEPTMHHYVNEISALFATLLQYSPNWKHPIMTPEKTPQKMLVILIGSQKGLCGSFNLNLFKLCEHCMKDIPQFQGHDEFIGVGKKAVEFLKKGNLHSIVQTFEKFGPKNLAQIAQEITNSILTASSAYTDVVILSNEFKSFFNQKPLSFTLLPFQKSDSIPDIPIQEDMIWEQSPHDLLDALVPQYLEALIHFKLFESLLAEHAARFVSMETATQNADGLLDAAKLQYNKLRQAKITRELSELSGNFE